MTFSPGWMRRSDEARRGKISRLSAVSETAAKSRLTLYTGFPTFCCPNESGKRLPESRGSVHPGGGDQVFGVGTAGHQSGFGPGRAVELRESGDEEYTEHVSIRSGLASGNQAGERDRVKS